MTADKKAEFMSLLKTECDIEVSFDKSSYYDWTGYDKELLLGTLSTRQSLIINIKINQEIVFIEDLVRKCPNLELKFSSKNLTWYEISRLYELAINSERKVADQNGFFMILSYTPKPADTQYQELHQAGINIFSHKVARGDLSKGEEYKKYQCTLL